MKTQEQMYYGAFAKRARVNEAFMEMVQKNDITSEELEKLIAKRPHIYGHLINWIKKLPKEIRKRKQLELHCLL